MRLLDHAAYVVIAGVLGSVSYAQNTAVLNEIYASHTGTDDMEFIELLGPPGSPLDGHLVLVVEGDGAGAGTLDRVFDLSGQSIPVDGYFVLGDAAVPAVDLVIGSSNTIENGTETLYLVQTTNPGAISGLLGTDVSNGPNTTVIPNMSTVLDLVAMVDGGFPATDTVYDGATPIGPDGSFFPAGIYRGADFPNGWCGASFLDFDPAVNTTEPSTAGAQNSVCQPGQTTIFGLDHVTLGQSGLRRDGGLVVSNIGSSGCDGVSIDLGEIGEVATGELVVPANLPQSASCLATAFGQVSGLTGRVVSTLQGQAVPGGEIQITPDFSPIGASSSTVQLFLGGMPVFQQSGNTGPGCRFPLPPSCLGSCGTLPGGSPGTVLRFPAGPLPVTIPGGPTIQADTLVLTPDNPTLLVDFISRVDLRAADIPMFTILDEALRLFDRDHRSIGAATLQSSSSGHLTISNIGSSGKDGVSIDLGDTDEGFEVELAPVDLSVPGTGITVEAVGRFNGSPGTSLGTAGCMNNGGMVQAFADFSTLGASGVRIEAYFQGQFQGTESVPFGTVGTVTQGPLGPPRITGCGKLPPDPPCFVVLVDPPGVFTPTGSTQSFQFDCVRLLAAGTMGSIDSLSRFDVQGVDLSAFQADDERDRTRFAGLTHRDVGGARLDTSGGTLVVSNIGSSGCDGVSIDLGETPNFLTGELTFLPAVLPPGLGCLATATGQVGGQSGRTLSTLRATALNSPTPEIQIEPDFSPLGASTHTVELFLGGSPVFSQAGQSGPGCIFPPPPSCVGTCGAPPIGGPAFIRIDFPTAIPVTIPGGPTLQADRMVLTAEGATQPAGALEELVLTALCPTWDPDLPLASLGRHGVGIFERAHFAVGDAELSPGGTRLKVSNLGSSGCDGVSIDLGDTDTGFKCELEPVSLATPGSGIFAGATGTFGGTPNSNLGSAGCQNNNGMVQASADFSPIGSGDVRIEVFDNGTLVGTAVVPGGGVVGTVDPGPAGPPSIRAVGKVLPYPPCFVIDLDRLALFTPVGGAGLMGDEVRLLANSASANIDRLSTFSLLGADLDVLEIQGEEGFDPGLGTRYCVAAPNSFSASGASLSADGSSVVADNDLTFTASGSPQGFGIVFYGTTQIQAPFGDGFRCTGGATQRVQPPTASTNNQIVISVDLTLPAHSTRIVPGADLNFQCWYRDNPGMAAGFNLSDALNIAFQ